MPILHRPAGILTPCPACPWRRSNWGKRTPGGFYTNANLRRLWNRIRRGFGQQTCHLTDPAHPDHVAAGTPETAIAHECPGSVIIAAREVEKVNGFVENEETDKEYRKADRRGLTREGLFYWMMRFKYGQDGEAAILAGLPPALPGVSRDDFDNLATFGRPGDGYDLFHQM